MAEKKIKTRIQNKHDTAANWASATFAPMAGEIIIYDKDGDGTGSTHAKPRIKVGDGTTKVGDLDFVVDKEETDKRLADIDSKVFAAVKGVTVSGKTLTFQRVDGTTFNITTQDTDTKVTNTSNATTKAYVTGTTASGTTTQVFDPNVYLDTTAGQLVATTFKGNLTGTASKATGDGSGNNIASTYETKAASSSKLSEAKTYADTKTANMNKEAYLSWGGKSISNGLGPLATALSAEHSANRIAYLNPAALSFERSNDSGASWTAYSVSNDIKTSHVTTTGTIQVGSATPVTTSHRTRMTLTATTSSTTYVYFRPRKLLIYVSTPHGLQVTVEYKSGASTGTYTTLGTYPLSGWSGWNEIDISTITTLGGSSTQTSNIWYLRLTYAVTGTINSDYTTTLPHISGIRIFGETCWTETSYMGKTGHLYNYDTSQNATFPAKVKANGGFEGNLTGTATNATNATTAATAATATYATTAGSADDAVEASHAAKADYATDAGHAATASVAANATSATKATQDASGNVITTTYATKSDLETIISSGTSDPTASTPGKFYFKYLT